MTYIGSDPNTYARTRKSRLVTDDDRPKSRIERYADEQTQGATPEELKKYKRDGAVIVGSAGIIAGVLAALGLMKLGGKAAKSVGGWEESLKRAMRDSTTKRR